MITTQQGTKNGLLSRRINDYWRSKTRNKTGFEQFLRGTTPTACEEITNAPWASIESALNAGYRKLGIDCNLGYVKSILKSTAQKKAPSPDLGDIDE